MVYCCPPQYVRRIAGPCVRMTLRKIARVVTWPKWARLRRDHARQPEASIMYVWPAAVLVAETFKISQSALYHTKKPRKILSKIHTSVTDGHVAGEGLMKGAVCMLCSHVTCPKGGLCMLALAEVR